MICKLCQEKDTEIKRILSGYKKDKEYYRRIIKILAIAFLVSIGELILSLAYGKDGIMMGIELLKGIIK